MMRRASMATWCCVLGLLSACGRSDADQELASELRALRLQLRAPAPAASAAADTQAVAAAMAPLREVLEGLANSQRELQAKQLNLTQELQRWSQLLVESTVGAHAEQGKALGLRLQQLEASLHEQGERHRQVETLLQGALDRTADRLEGFLQQLETVRPRVSPNAPPSDPKVGPVPAPPAGKSADSSAPPVGGQVQPTPAESPRMAMQSPWLWCLVALGAVAVSVLCWRAAVGGNRRAVSASLAHPTVAGEPATQELWEAAALLGEVVGRLRAASAPGIEVSASEPAVRAEHVNTGEIEDLFVLDEEPQSAEHAAVEPVVVELEPAERSRSAPRGSDARSSAPAPVTCHLHPRDLLAATKELLRILAADPRVLRRPAPRLTPCGSTLEVSFVLLPGLPPGEQSQLEQRLRDAVA